MPLQDACVCVPPCHLTIILKGASNVVLVVKNSFVNAGKVRDTGSIPGLQGGLLLPEPGPQLRELLRLHMQVLCAGLDGSSSLRLQPQLFTNHSHTELKNGLSRRECWAHRLAERAGFQVQEMKSQMGSVRQGRCSHVGKECW